MKQYAEIWLPADTIPARLRAINDIFVEVQSNKIVLTLEELEKLWNAGAQHGFDSDFGGPSPDFKTYLKEQGIEL